MYRDEILHRGRGPRRNHPCKFRWQSVKEGAGVEFSTLLLTCVVVLKTLWHYRARVWCLFRLTVNICFVTSRNKCNKFVSSYMMQQHEIHICILSAYVAMFKFICFSVFYLRIDMSAGKKDFTDLYMFQCMCTVQKWRWQLCNGVCTSNEVAAAYVAVVWWAHVPHWRHIQDHHIRHAIVLPVCAVKCRIFECGNLSAEWWKANIHSWCTAADFSVKCWMEAQEVHHRLSWRANKCSGVSISGYVTLNYVSEDTVLQWLWMATLMYRMQFHTIVLESALLH